MIKLYTEFKKVHVIKIFGSVGNAAKALRIRSSSFSEWPETLNDSMKDRVIGAVLRENKRKEYYAVMEENGIEPVFIK